MADNLFTKSRVIGVSDSEGLRYYFFCRQKMCLHMRSCNFSFCKHIIVKSLTIINKCKNKVGRMNAGRFSGGGFRGVGGDVRVGCGKVCII